VTTSLGTGGAGSTANRRVADILPEAEHRADWSRVRALFRQLVQLVASGVERAPDELVAAFADAIAEISASYARDEAQLSLHALAVLADVECLEVLDLDLFKRYYEDDRSALGVRSSRRRQPAAYEAIVETCRRLRDARCLRGACRNAGTSGVLVGSTSYGRFYNVRGNRQGGIASDLDFIIVVEHAGALGRISEALKELPYARPSDLSRFVLRADVFANSLDDGYTVFSHKVRLWADGAVDPLLPSGAASAQYFLSLHIMTKKVLDYALVTSTPRLLREMAGSRRTLRDFRETPAARWDDLYDFSGRRHRIELGGHGVEDGWVRLPRVYHLDDLDCYFPGFYQSMLFPRPELLWDDLDISPLIDEFRRKLGERVRYEANLRGPALLLPSLAHVRRDVFAPSVIKSLDGDYSGS